MFAFLQMHARYIFSIECLTCTLFLYKKGRDSSTIYLLPLECRSEHVIKGKYKGLVKVFGGWKGNVLEGVSWNFKY